MEYTIYIGIFFVLLAAVAVKMAISNRKLKKRIKRKIKEDWNRPIERTYEYEEFESISVFFRKMSEGKEVLDDITWKDLDMDLIFMEMNRTYSSMGEEYLYYMLRTPLFQVDELAERERLIQYFRTHEQEREALQFVFYKIGRTRKVSVSEYMERLLDTKKENNFWHYAMAASIVLGAASFLITPQLGIVALLTVISVNVISYYRRKAEIEPYIITMSHILRMLSGAEEFEKIKIPELSEYINHMMKIKKTFSGFRKNAYLLIGANNMGGNLEDVLLDYLRMLFHVDIIKFNSMHRKLCKSIHEINELISCLGQLEGAIAAAYYREQHKDQYCIPRLFKTEKARLKAENIYHPLISEPVKNSIEAEKGVLITGSNASGKSTFLKTIAINAILAQTIHICLAEEYESSYFRIYSSMTLQDNLLAKESYYIVEVKSIKRILEKQNGEYPVLCFVDEVLRGTNTVERIAASAQILKSFAEKGALSFAATHDIELTHLLKEYYDNYHFREEIKDGDILFNYRIYPGGSKTRNAIQLLGIIGYEDSVIENAEKTARLFEEEGIWKL